MEAKKTANQEGKPRSQQKTAKQQGKPRSQKPKTKNIHKQKLKNTSKHNSMIIIFSCHVTDFNTTDANLKTHAASTLIVR